MLCELLSTSARQVSSIGEAIETLNAGAVVRCCFHRSTRETCAVVCSKMRGNLIKSALSPLFCLCQPKLAAFCLHQSALWAHQFLISDFNELVHSLQLPQAKPIYPRYPIVAKSYRFAVAASAGTAAQPSAYGKR